MNGIPLATAALVIGIVLLAAAAVTWSAGADGFVIGWLGVVGVLCIAGTIFERVRYKPIAPAPPLGPGWLETNERFRDPATDRWVQVYFKPETGERRYVEIPPPTG
jgi:hypothetical protein